MELELNSLTDLAYDKLAHASDSCLYASSDTAPVCIRCVRSQNLQVKDPLTGPRTRSATTVDQLNFGTLSTLIKNPVGTLRLTKQSMTATLSSGMGSQKYPI